MSVDDGFGQPKDGQTWGNWKLSTRELVLKYTAGGGYEIDLEDMRSSAHVLDWLAQVSGKTWATAEDLGDLVHALDDIFNLQARFCGGSEDKSLDAGSYLRSAFQHADE